MPRIQALTNESSSSIEIPEITPPTASREANADANKGTSSTSPRQSQPVRTASPPFPLSVSSGSIRKVSKSRQKTTLSYANIVDPALKGPPPTVAEAITYRTHKGKPVRDVLIDTHDLINEPGGFILNLLDDPNPETIDVHVGIKEKHCLASDSLAIGVLSPGTITVSDDYARDIFRAAIYAQSLKVLRALLEIKDSSDLHEFKTFKEYSPEFLTRFISSYPSNLTVFHVEMPGVSLVYLPEWKFLMDQQRSLQVLICNFGVVLWYYYETCILQNVRTLKTVILRRISTYDITSSKYCAFEWNTFADCRQLEYLKITSGYKSNAEYLGLPVPPSAVFVHTNLETLPDSGTFEQLHLAGIWIDPGSLYSFMKRRPQLKLCSPCFDMEYSSTDKPPNERKFVGATTVKIISVSRIQPEEDIDKMAVLDKDVEDLEDDDDDPRKRKKKKEAKLSCLVVAMLQVILLALAILFIIIFFRHIRPNFQRNVNQIHNQTKEATFNSSFNSSDKRRWV